MSGLPPMPPPPGDEPPFGGSPPPYGGTPPPYGQGGYQQYGYGYGYGSGQRFEYSGFWRRAGASILDSLVLLVPNLLVGLVLGSAAVTSGSSFAFTPGVSAVRQLVSYAIGVAYFAYFDGLQGQTPGKKALGIKVVDADTGEVIGAGRGVGRYFARILSGLALGLGYLWMLWDGRKQCWHDKLVRSVVVRTQ